MALLKRLWVPFALSRSNACMSCLARNFKTGGVILSLVHSDDLPLIAKLKIGMPVTVCINALRGAKLVRTHTASHLLCTATIHHDYHLEERTIRLKNLDKGKEQLIFEFTSAIADVRQYYRGLICA